jgi:hypothetical protein
MMRDCVGKIYMVFGRWGCEKGCCFLRGFVCCYRFEVLGFLLDVFRYVYLGVFNEIVLGFFDGVVLCDGWLDIGEMFGVLDHLWFF